MSTDVGQTLEAGSLRKTGPIRGTSAAHEQ